MTLSSADPKNHREDAVLYDIIFEGRIQADRDIEDVKSRLAILYRVDVNEIERLFDNPPITLKSGLDYAAAMADKAEFETTGALCRVVSSAQAHARGQGPKTQGHRQSFFKRARSPKSPSTERRYHIFHPVFMAFYSKTFYHDVAKHWRGRAFLFLLLLTSFLTALVCVQIHLRMAAYIDRFGEAFVEQIPTITIQDGKAAIDQPQPYVIEDPETDQAAAILDTTGKTLSLSGTSAVVLLTSDQLILKRSPVDTQIFDLTHIDDFRFDQSQARSWMITMRKWSALIVFPLLLFGNLLYRIAQVLIYVGIGLIMTRILNHRLPLGALFSLSIMAITPAIVINTLLPTGIATSFVWDILSIVISVGFLHFGIKATAQIDAGASPSSPS